MSNLSTIGTFWNIVGHYFPSPPLHSPHNPSMHKSKMFPQIFYVKSCANSPRTHPVILRTFHKTEGFYLCKFCGNKWAVSCGSRIWQGLGYSGLGCFGLQRISTLDVEVIRSGLPLPSGSEPLTQTSVPRENACKRKVVIRASENGW